MPSQYSVLSLFTGAGGLDVGLERTGRFVIQGAVELDPTFCATLEANQEKGLFGTMQTKVICADIEASDPLKILDTIGVRPGELDLLVGGPPCQTFSTAGRRGTTQDPRGMLIWAFARYVAATRPKFFLMENVRGLLSAALVHRQIRERPAAGGPPLRPEERPGSVVEHWLRALWQEAPEYRVDCFEVNAVNYGAPQLRERVLFFGNRLGQVVDFPAPTHGSQPGLLPFMTLGDALATVSDDDGERMDFSPRKQAYLEMVPEGGNWRTLPPEVQRESMGRAWLAKGGRSGWWRRLSRDLPAPTVVTMPNHAGTSMCHPTQTRALTLKECAAIQGFPPGWVFRGTTQQKYTQVGNACPVRLGEVAGNVLAAELGRNAGRSAGDGEPPPYRQVYLKSHVRTRQWYRNGRPVVWIDGEENVEARYSARRRPSAASERGLRQALPDIGAALDPKLPFERVG